MEKKLLAAAVVLAMGLVACDGDDGDDGATGQVGPAGADGSDGADGLDGTSGGGALRRIATAPLGAEFTGMFLAEDGTFFLNVQHPSSSNTTADASGRVFDLGSIGYIANVDFNNLGDVQAMDPVISTADRETVQTALGNYKVLAQQNDIEINGNGFLMGDIVDASGTTAFYNGNDPDFNGAISDGNGGMFLYTNWEQRPGGMSRLHLDAGMTVQQSAMLDFSPVHGTWVNCFGEVSPWGTPLTSEELYFDDTENWFDFESNAISQVQSIATYLGYPTDGSGQWPNPYRYGYVVEIGVDDTATAASPNDVKMKKQYTLGRFSHENSITMPDNRTVFLSDDGTGTVLYKFVADTAGDLSAGTLYAAKATQLQGVKNPAEAAFAINWIRLGSSTHTELEAAIAEYDSATPASPNYITQQQIEAQAAGEAVFADDRVAFLESRKFAAAKGATAEFRKMEGIQINKKLGTEWYNGGDQAYMYLAMSSFDATMGDDEGDIQLDASDGRCGVVYRMKLMKKANGLVDIDSMVPAQVGGPYAGDRTENQCSINNISNPDNLAILDDGRVLIGEDTGNHSNNVIWLFDDPAI